MFNLRLSAGFSDLGAAGVFAGAMIFGCEGADFALDFEGGNVFAVTARCFASFISLVLELVLDLAGCLADLPVGTVLAGELVFFALDFDLEGCAGAGTGRGTLLVAAGWVPLPALGVAVDRFGCFTVVSVSAGEICFAFTGTAVVVAFVDRDDVDAAGVDASFSDSEQGTMKQTSCLPCLETLFRVWLLVLDGFWSLYLQLRRSVYPSPGT